jgi:hypothetical protein
LFTVTKSNYGPKPEALVLERREGSGVLYPSRQRGSVVEVATGGGGKAKRSVFDAKDLF